MRTTKTRLFSATLALLFLPLTMIATPGCESWQREEEGLVGQPDLALRSSAREIYAGELVTVTAATQNLVGREADIQWTTTGGELTTEENGRIARVRFDRAGTYVVSAQLLLNGEVVRTDQTTVVVRPLR